MIRLGVRLALAGGPVRVLSLLLGGALSVALLGLAWELPDALYPRYQDPLEPGSWLAPPQRGSAVAMSTLMLAPVLMLLIATGRLSAVVRDQRLVSLRLIGVSKGRTLVAAVAENVSITVLGVVVGLGLLRAGAWAVDTYLPVEQPFYLGHGQLISLALAVVTLSGLLALGSARTLELLPTQARRGGVATKASWWRVLPLLVSMGCFGMIISGAADTAADTAAQFFLAGVATGALAIVTSPALVARHTAAALRRSRRVCLMMAGRGIEADPTSATRRVAAVGVGLFVVVLMAGVVNAWETVPQSRYATHIAERGPQDVTVYPWTAGGEPATITETDVAAFAALPEVDHVVRDYGLQGTGCDDDGWSGCVQPFVGTCDQLTAYLPVTGCSDEEAAWLDTSDKWAGGADDRARPSSIELQGAALEHPGAEPATDALTVHASGPPIGVAWRQVEESRGFVPEFELFIPEHLVAGLDLPLHSLDVVGPAGRGFASAVGHAAEERGLQAPAWSYGDYETLVSIRTMLASAGGALVAVVVLVVTLSILDWLRESRRPRMRMLAAGVPRGVIARAYLVQFAIPLVGAVALGGLLGGAGIRAYEIMGDTVGTFNLPATYWWLVGTLVIGVLLAAGLASLAARERMRPSDLRRE